MKNIIEKQAPPLNNTKTCFKGCKYIGFPQLDDEKAPFFKKSITIADAVKDSKIYLCGLGYHELYVNGEKVGDSVLTPPQSLYDKTVYYISYDISEHLIIGENVVHILLGNGFFNCFDPMAWFFDTSPWRDKPKMMLYGEVLLKNGAVIKLYSDETFEVGESQTTYNMIFGGETQDLRKPNIFKKESLVGNASIVRGPGGVLKEFYPPYVTETETLIPIKVIEKTDGRKIFDFGQNLSGWAKISARANRKSEITLKYAEILDENEELDLTGIGDFVKLGRFQTDCYIFDGDNELSCARPHFTYHGFRYVEVSMTQGDFQELEDFEMCAIFVHSKITEIGNFKCSDDNVNKLFEMAKWATLSNVVNIPTDCPQREKNGWTGDSVLSAEQMCFHYDMKEVFRRWLHDIRDSQRPSGQIPGIVPSHKFGYNWGSGPVWDCVLFELPHTYYRYHGDFSLCAENYEAMLKYLDFCESMSNDYTLDFGLGDWCPPVGHPSEYDCPEIISDTAYYFYMANIAADISLNLNRHMEYDSLILLAENIKKSFERNFVDMETGEISASCGDHRDGKHSQTSQAVAIHFNLLDEDVAKKAAEKLVEIIKNNNGFLNFGILGSKTVFEALSRYGYGSLAFEMIMKKGFPSYRNWIDMGATTFLEMWDGTQSNNHHMFSDVCRWFIQFVSGLKVPNFKTKTIEIAPDFVGDLTYASAKTEAGIYKYIFSCEWGKNGDEYLLTYKVSPQFKVIIKSPKGYASTEHFIKDGEGTVKFFKKQ